MAVRESRLKTIVVHGDCRSEVVSSLERLCVCLNELESSNSTPLKRARPPRTSGDSKIRGHILIYASTESGLYFYK